MALLSVAGHSREWLQGGLYTTVCYLHFFIVDYSLPERGWSIHWSYVWWWNTVPVESLITVGWNWEGGGKCGPNTGIRGGGWTVIYICIISGIQMKEKSLKIDTHKLNFRKEMLANVKLIEIVRTCSVDWHKRGTNQTNIQRSYQGLNFLLHLLS